ncbi:odorant receptor 9a-like [Leptopilina boulardi]|uniref:odorant receptor 9a-like n=1 Tax=Leptopilina boulardi TaxID=63433 RepID=UPI0021F512D8|nr:odorant receptor 9a-like [Leptopilina boulardi]
MEKKSYPIYNCKLYLGEISFILLQLFGIFKPLTWNTKWKTLIYYLYSIFMITIYFYFDISILLFLLLKAQNIDNEMESLYHFLAFFTVFFKMITIFLHSKIAIELVNLFKNKLCQPRDDVELKILQNTSYSCRFYTILYLFITNSTSISLFLIPPSKRSDFPLPFKMWIPYSLNSRLLYFLTYIHQGLGTTMGACVTSAIEGIALMTILQICAQYEIFIYRLNLLSQLSTKKNYNESFIYNCETKIIKDCVELHCHIFTIGKKLNNLFDSAIFVQFFVSMLGLGAITFQLSRLTVTDPRLWGLMCALSVTLVQIFLYCIFGEQIKTKSFATINEIYEMNWSTITNKTKRNLMLIMIRAAKPLNFMGFKLIIMSIGTFVQIVKSAYSAYNLLKGF